MEAAAIIWKEAMERRRQWERVDDEDEEAAERELRWGMGEVEK